MLEMENPECQICSRPAKGVYYKVLACSGCRTFYERSVRKKCIYNCQARGECAVQYVVNRNGWCRACRHRKWQTLIAKASGGNATSQIKRARVKQGSTSKSVKSRRKGGSEEDATRAGSADSPEVDAVVSRAVQQVYDTTDHEPKYCLQPAPEIFECLLLPGSGNHLSKSSKIHVNHANELIFERGERPRNMAPSQKSDHDLWMPPIDDGLRLFLSHEGHRHMGVNPITSTYFAVGAAMERSFGDQISDWTRCMEDAAQSRSTMVMHDADMDTMLTAMKNHICEVFYRMMRFKDLLPGFSKLDPDAKRCAARHWKVLLTSLIHHSPFMTADDCYVTVGPRRLRSIGYWLEKRQTENWTLHVLLYKLSRLIRDLGLNQVERYLLITAIFLEPDADVSANIRLTTLHRHYTSVLLHVIAQRCKDTAEQLTISRKLENFFGVISDAVKCFALECGVNGRCPPQFELVRMEVNKIQTETEILQRQNNDWRYEC